MPWPSPTDYNEAVQNPRLGFADPELKLGQPEFTPLGTPRPYSGAFATVYKMQCGSRTWAVRCFNREFHDQQERYEAIGAHLARVRLPYTVGFQYLRRGILVRGLWYPIVKMEWIRGETLGGYIAKHLGSVQTLLHLAEQWQRMLQDLRAAAIAHGDLSHGNILVVEDQLRLVDYDGMFVPALAGRETHEIGHRNYQHPARTRQHFGPQLDHFSAWVVYVSLLALSADPGLWQQFHGGDECLLLRKTDFENPANSPLLAVLSQSPDPRTRQAAQDFQALLRLSPEALPPLGVAPPRQAATICAGCGRQLGVRVARCPKCGLEVAGGSAGVPDWLADYLPKAPARAVAEVKTEAGTASDIAWIFDRLATNARPGSFAASVTAEHLLCWAAILISAVLGGLTGLELIPLLALLQILAALYPFLMIFLAVRYRSDPAVRERIETLRTLRPVQRRLRKIEKRSRSQLKVTRRLKTREDGLLATQRNRGQAIDRRERLDLDAVQAEFRRQLSAAAIGRQRLLADEAAVHRRLEAEFTRKIGEITAQINDLAQDEDRRRDAALRDFRSVAMMAHLQRYRISSAAIPGVGEGLVRDLTEAGIITAAHVVFSQVQRVRGIGSSELNAILQWRRHLETVAVLPSALPGPILQELRAETEAKREKLEEERLRKQRQLANERAIVRNSYAKSRDDLDRADGIAQAKSQNETLRIAHTSQWQRERLRQRIEPQSRKIAMQLNQIQVQASLSRQQECELAWKRSQLQHRLDAVRRLTFAAYLRRVLVGN